jgi:FkbM family methyltransferase
MEGGMYGMKKITTILSLCDVPKGERFLDKLILFLLRITYFGVRLSLRLVIGKKLRDKFFVRHGLDFPTFTYKLLKKFGLDKVLLLLIDMPKQGYKFFCRINRDDFLFMTNHENEIMEFFIPKEGDTVVDVGAHIGLYTLIAAKRVGPSGKVIAIEPDPENCNLLKRNVELNRLTNVITLECAAFSSNSKLKLYLPGKERGFTKLGTIMTNRAVTENFLEIDATTLDHLMMMQGIAQVNWIKIDVEGAELEVLKGATLTLSVSKDIALLVEIHNVNNMDLHSAIVKFLKPYEFHVEFERKYANGERHILLRKTRSSD